MPVLCSFIILDLFISYNQIHPHKMQSMFVTFGTKISFVCFTWSFKEQSSPTKPGLHWQPRTELPGNFLEKHRLNNKQLSWLTCRRPTRPSCRTGWGRGGGSSPGQPRRGGRSKRRWRAHTWGWWEGWEEGWHLPRPLQLWGQGWAE